MTAIMLASRAALRSRPLQTRTAASGVSASSGTLSMRLCHPVQLRTFRFGIWSSSFDSSYHRELRRRHRSLRHKYIDDIDRRLSWHDFERPLVDESRRVLKRAMAQFWTPNASTGTPRFGNYYGFVNRQMFPFRPPFAAWGSYIDQIINPPVRQTSSDTRFRREKSMRADRPSADRGTDTSEPRETILKSTGSTIEKDYIIDPITNRKVPRRERKSTEIDPEPSSQATKASNAPSPGLKSSPVYSNDEKSTSDFKKELNRYAESKFDDWPTAGPGFPVNPAKSASHPESGSYVPDNSTPKSEEYALNHLPLEDPTENYGDFINQPTSAPKEPLEKPSGSSIHQDKIGWAEGQRSAHNSPCHQAVSEPDKMQNELRNYGPYMHDEDVPTHPDLKDSKDLDKYQYYASQEPEISTQPYTIHDDTREYDSTTLEDPKERDQPFEQYGDLEKYKAFRLQHLDMTAPLERDVVTESLKEYEMKDNSDGIVDIIDPSSQNMSQRIPQSQPLEGHVFSKHYSNGTGAENNPPFREIPTEKHLDHFLAAQNSNANGESTGNEPAALRTSQFETTQPIVQNAEKYFGDSHNATEEVSHPASNQSGNGPKLEAALDRYPFAMKGSRLASSRDFYSKEPQGLETSFSEECGGKHTLPLYATTYGIESGQAASTSELAMNNQARKSERRPSNVPYDRDPEVDGLSPSERAEIHNQKGAQPEEPTVYKVLAYDPTAQTISVAETSSVVSDASPPVSPTEVLLRLSNPTKFLPHFAPLHAEGFEIVAGGGDLLVFRQARSAMTAVKGGVPSVNPIDLMGRSTAVPNAAAFVSPTGFVNYDMPRVEDEATAQADRSFMGVRREERVLNGQESPAGDNESNKPKMNASKRMIIGGVWVAGLSYALGVVSEYFTTGGMDGEGPTGFSPV
ncbi:hypothetical protein F5Y14DRAFT_7256 [Nemania sp. NC0429]|nr:hypothetical protein F5Y14DRAFT_7256 [Nemania sp. NC0429]